MRSPQVEQPAISDEKQNEDAPDKVMDVMSVNHDPTKGTMIVDHELNQQPHTRKSEKERYGGNEHASAGAIGDGRTDNESESSELQEHEQDDNDHAGKREQQQGSGSGHTLLKHPDEGFPEWIWRLEADLDGVSPVTTTLYKCGIYWLRRQERHNESCKVDAADEWPKGISGARPLMAV